MPVRPILSDFSLSIDFLRGDVGGREESIAGPWRIFFIFLRHVFRG